MNEDDYKRCLAQAVEDYKALAPAVELAGKLRRVIYALHCLTGEDVDESFLPRAPYSPTARSTGQRRAAPAGATPSGTPRP